MELLVDHAHLLDATALELEFAVPVVIPHKWPPLFQLQVAGLIFTLHVIVGVAQRLTTEIIDLDHDMHGQIFVMLCMKIKYLDADLRPEQCRPIS